MTNIVNHSPFSVGNFGLLDQHGTEVELIVVSATFEALPGKTLRLADKQAPVRDVDEYFGEPGFSSMRYEADIALEKPFVDVVVNGRAFAPGGKSKERVRVSLRVGDLRKELIVSGDRFWRRGVLGRVPSSPKPFKTMPIIYERAYGGIATSSSKPEKQYSDPRNPIGVGFRGAKCQNPDIETAVPNVEYPSAQVSSPRSKSQPAAFGALARNWQPRASWAGTYDDKWQQEQFPLLPLDFDTRYYQVAPIDQQMSSVRGGEIVELINMTPQERWAFKLPIIDIPVYLSYTDRIGSASLKPDTILIEPDYYRFTITGRSKIGLERNAGPLEEIIIERVTP